MVACPGARSRGSSRVHTTTRGLKDRSSEPAGNARYLAHGCRAVRGPTMAPPSWNMLPLRTGQDQAKSRDPLMMTSVCFLPMGSIISRAPCSSSFRCLARRMGWRSLYTRPELTYDRLQSDENSHTPHPLVLRDAKHGDVLAPSAASVGSNRGVFPCSSSLLEDVRAEVAGSTVLISDGAPPTSSCRTLCSCR
jgi:hypothetical protein